MNLHPDVAKALEDGRITMNVASNIATLEKSSLQAPFLLYILSNNIEHDDIAVGKAKKRFLNNTIYSIGYGNLTYRFDMNSEFDLFTVCAIFNETCVIFSYNFI